MWLFEIKYEDEEWIEETHEVKITRNHEFVLAEEFSDVYEKTKLQLLIKNRILTGIIRHDVPVTQIIKPE